MAMDPQYSNPQNRPPVESSAYSTGGLATALTALLSVCAVTSVASGLAGLRRAGTIADVQAGVAAGGRTLTEADVMVGAAVVTDSLLTLATGVVFIVWFWRSIKNSQLLEGATRYSGSALSGTTAPAAGWSIGSWLIPIANVVLPAYFLARVDRLSGSAAGSGDDPSADHGARPLIICWAIAWGVANVLSRLLWRGTSDELSALASADRRDMWIALVYLAAAVLAILMVRAITSRQQRAFGAPALA